MENKRQFPRAKSPRVLLKIPSADRLKTHYLKDLSSGGAFIRLSNPLPIGSLLTVELHAPGLDAPLTMPARVVRIVAQGDVGSEPPGMAVKFEQTDPDVSARLTQLVLEHLETGEATAPTEAVPAGSSAEGISAATFAAEQQRRERAEARAAGLEQQLEARAREATDLRTELAEAAGRLGALEEQLHTVEQDEATGRALAEKLAAEKARAEKQLRDEVARQQAEQQRLQAQAFAAQAEQQRLQAQVFAAQAEAARAGAALEQAQRAQEAAVEAARRQAEASVEQTSTALERERARLEAERDAARSEEQLSTAKAGQLAASVRTKDEQLAAQQRQIASLEKRLQDVSEDLERVKRREGALRQLVDVMKASSLAETGNAAPTTDTAEPPAPSAPPPIFEPRDMEPLSAPLGMDNPPPVADTPSEPELLSPTLVQFATPNAAPPYAPDEHDGLRSRTLVQYTTPPPWAAPPPIAPAVPAFDPFPPPPVAPAVPALDPFAPPPVAPATPVPAPTFDPFAPIPGEAGEISLTFDPFAPVEEAPGDPSFSDSTDVQFQGTPSPPAPQPPLIATEPQSFAVPMPGPEPWAPPAQPAQAVPPPGPEAPFEPDEVPVDVDDWGSLADPGAAERPRHEDTGPLSDVEVDLAEPAMVQPVPTFEEFVAALEAGARIHTVPTFDESQVVDPGERMVSAMLQEEQTLEELLDRASAHPVRDQFVRILHGFCARRLIEIVGDAAT